MGLIPHDSVRIRKGDVAQRQTMRGHQPTQEVAESRSSLWASGGAHHGHLDPRLLTWGTVHR